MCPVRRVATLSVLAEVTRTEGYPSLRRGSSSGQCVKNVVGLNIVCKGGYDAVDAMSGPLSASVVPALRKKREERGTHYLDSASEIKAGTARLPAFRRRCVQREWASTSAASDCDCSGNRGSGWHRHLTHLDHEETSVRHSPTFGANR